MFPQDYPIDEGSSLCCFRMVLLCPIDLGFGSHCTRDGSADTNPTDDLQVPAPMQALRRTRRRWRCPRASPGRGSCNSIAGKAESTPTAARTIQRGSGQQPWSAGVEPITLRSLLQQVASTAGNLESIWFSMAPLLRSGIAVLQGGAWGWANESHHSNCRETGTFAVVCVCVCARRRLQEEGSGCTIGVDSL